MSIIKEAVNTPGAFVCTLASLASSSSVGRQTTVIDNSANLFTSALVTVNVKTGATGVVASGFMSVYAFGTTDGGAIYTDNAGAADAGLTVSAMRLIGTFPAVANATTYVSQQMNVEQAFGGILPTKWGIVVVNSSGGALDATAGNHVAQYQEFYATVV